MLDSLFKKHSTDVLGAFVIYLPNSSVSVQMADRCLESCNKVGQRVELFEGFDGTKGSIKVPEHLRTSDWVKWLKVTDHFQSASEVAVSMSHIALWVKCMTEDRPLIILEHDAIMVQAYNSHPFYNAIAYLGCKEQLGHSNLPPTPMHSSINRNWHFINRAHAYCVDPSTARRLFTNVLDRGIFESADVMIKCDDVAIVQPGFYAYDKDDGLSTQTKRKQSDDHRFNK